MNVIKKELTDEVKARLKAYSPVTTSKIFKFIPWEFRENLPLNECPVFDLQYPDSISNMSGDFRELGDKGEVRILLGKMKLHFFRLGVKGWKNYPGLEFKPEYIKDGQLTDEAIQNFPPLMISSLADAIITESALSDEELQGL